MSYLVFAGKSNDGNFGLYEKNGKIQKTERVCAQRSKKSKILKIFGINIKNI